MIRAIHRTADMENEKVEPNEMPTAHENVAPAADDRLEDNSPSELNQKRWSIITFEQCVAKNMTYFEAVQKLHELKKQNEAGLCIVADEAAARVSNC